MSPKAIDHVINSDVLVIGSGLAGSMAALKCHQLGKNVVIANKGPMCGGGATSVLGGKTMNVCFPEDDKDYWIQKFLELANYEVDQEWLRIHLDETYNYALELDKLGQEYKLPVFPRDPRDKGQGLWRIGPWEVEGIKNVVFYGFAAEAAFKRKFLKEKIPFFERMEMTNLLSDGQKIIGAVGFNYRTGETSLFKAKAVILATGGIRFGDNEANNVGEGVTMAYGAGISVRSLGKERARFKPKYNTYVGALGDGYYGNGTTYPFDGKIVNRLGEAFMEKALPGTELNMAIHREIEEGRGPIYEDWAHLPVELHDILKTIKKPHWKLTKTIYGVDVFKSRVPFPEQQEQIALPGRTAHFGVDVDYRCASRMPGLFAIGDNACNFTAKMPAHGGGTAWALLSGSRVAKYATEYVSSISDSAISDKQVLGKAKEYIATLVLPLTRTNGPSPGEVLLNFLLCLIPFDKISSSQESMEKCLSEIILLQQEGLPRIKAGDFHGLKKAIEVKSFLLNMEIILKTQLFRQKEGIPSKKHPDCVFVEKRDGQMHLYASSISGYFNEAQKEKLK